MILADLSWKEVEEYLKKRKDILLPFGAVEEHGHHLPLSTDGDIAMAVAEGISNNKGVVVAPIVWYGVCNTTAVFPGTITVGFDPFKAYVKDLFLSLKNSGFEQVYVVSGHLGGAHVSAIKEASRGIDLEMFFLDMRRVKTNDILETLPFHAGEGETSLMLFLHPKKVKMSLAIDEDIEPIDFSMTASVKVTKSGVWGTPSKASSKKGSALYSRIVKTLEKALR